MDAKKDLKAVENYGKDVAIGVDQLGNAALDGYPDETISSRAGRLRDKPGWKYLYRFFDWIKPGHCERAEESEREHLHEPPEFR